MFLQFVQDLDQEEKHAHRENLEEETLAVFDLLCKESLSPADRKRLKKIAVELLDRLKANQLKIDNWREKEAVQSTVKVEIFHYLYNEQTGLPVDSYTDKEVQEKSNLLFLHIFEKYPCLPSPAYSQQAA